MLNIHFNTSDACLNLFDTFKTLQRGLNRYLMGGNGYSMAISIVGP